jgi:thiamine biosynthesis lipoprotein
VVFYPHCCNTDKQLTEKIKTNNSQSQIIIRVQYSQKLFGDNNQLLYGWFSAMFTRVDIVIYDSATRKDLMGIVEKIEAEIARHESIGNRFDDKSELSIINRNAYPNEIPVSDELFSILSECLEYNQKSQGYFDITINSLNGFRNGTEAVKLNKQNQTIRFVHPDVRLDLSGFIKGYALRSAVGILKAENISNALVNLGNSSVYALGNHPYGEGWKVNIPGTNAECVLRNECLTTSGNEPGKQWPVKHPVTGEAPENKQPVSVITTDPAIGEAVSTAACLADITDLSTILKQFEAKILTANT